MIDHAIGLPDFDVVMVDYNVLRPEREPLIARAAAAGKGVLAGMPLAMGHTGWQIAKLRAPARPLVRRAWPVRHRRDVGEGARFGFLNRLSGMTGAQAALGLCAGQSRRRLRGGRHHAARPPAREPRRLRPEPARRR